VGADEGGDENLIFEGETGEFGEGKGAFNGDLLLRETDALDEDGASLGDAKEVLPVGRFGWF
jgi:hypothetical protein